MSEAPALPLPPVDLRIPNLAAPLQLHVHGEHDRHVSQQLRAHGIWEPFETALLLQVLQPDSVFVDVGANIGYFSLVAAAILRRPASVFAFEPDPDNFRLLQASARHNQLDAYICAQQLALADTDATGRLYLSGDNLGDHQMHADGTGRSSIPITVRNGSTFLRDRLQRLDFLKVDTQGAEHAVISGLMPLLQELPAAPRILIELTPLSLRQAGASGRALIELLAELSQPMWIVDHIEQRLVASNAGELARWCDNVDAVPGDEGFMNILLGPAP